MDYRALQHARGNVEVYYLEALRYAHFLWLRELPARAILALARALYADMPADSPLLNANPMPYVPLRWLLVNLPPHGDYFLGNPRLSFQHQAARLRGHRRLQRSWRAWAACCVVRTAMPLLPADPTITIPEPEADEIVSSLRLHGIPGEAEAFAAAVR